VDEGTRGLSSADSRSRAALLEAEATALRQRVDQLLDELDRRRRRAAGGLTAVRRYALPALIVVAAVGGGTLAVARWRRATPWYGRRGKVLRRSAPALARRMVKRVTEFLS
jgi:hypothetical protein